MMNRTYDIVMEPHTGALIQDTFADARALARVLNTPILVRGNAIEVWVHRHTTEEECRQMYDNALDGQSHRKRDDNGGWRCMK